MTNIAWIAIAAAVAIGLSALAAAQAQGRATAAAMDAIWRQPESANSIRSTLLLALSLMEALAIYGLLIGLLIIFMLRA
jgi:F-type H+-transporting ATPase subunit c